MNLADRIKAELDRPHDTDAFSMVAYDLLGEALVVIKQADHNFRSIVETCEMIDAEIERLQNLPIGREQAE